jgi:hypothetical protein
MAPGPNEFFVGGWPFQKESTPINKVKEYSICQQFCEDLYTNQTPQKFSSDRLDFRYDSFKF